MAQATRRYGKLTFALLLCSAFFTGLALALQKASIPVWAKMTPIIEDITTPARTALTAGCEGVAAIRSIQSVMEVNLKTP